MAKKIQDGNQIVTNVDSNDNLTFSIKSSFIDSTPTTNSTNLVTSGGVKSALDINTTDIAAAVIRIANNETNISNHTSAIQALNGSVSTNTTDISTNTSNIAELQTQVGTNTSNIATNTSNIASNEADIGTLNNLTTTDKTSLVNAINELNAPEKWVSVGTEAPTDGRRVWFKKSKNLADISQIQIGKSWSNENYVQRATILYIPIEKGKSYYLISTHTNSAITSVRAVVNHGINDKTSCYVVASFPYTNNNWEYVSIEVLANTTFTSEMLEGVQILFCEGSTATPYEPYVEPSINVDGEEWFKKFNSKM